MLPSESSQCQLGIKQPEMAKGRGPPDCLPAKAAVVPLTPNECAATATVVMHQEGGHTAELALGISGPSFDVTQAANAAATARFAVAGSHWHLDCFMCASKWQWEVGNNQASGSPNSKEAAAAAPTIGPALPARAGALPPGPSMLNVTAKSV